MTWKSDWWGITITADTKDDIKSLRYFISKLDEKPTETYEGGKLEVEDGEGILRLILAR